jgi:hypothetical protein
VNKTLTFSGTLPDRLFNTFITPKDWKYSDRIIEVNSLKQSVTGVTQSFTNLPKTLSYINNEGGFHFNLTDTQLGVFEVARSTVSTLDYYTFSSDYSFFLKKKLQFLVTIRAKDVLYTGETTRNGIGLALVEVGNMLGGLSIEPTITLLPNWVCGAYSGNTAGIAPTVNWILGLPNQINIDAFANATGFGYQGTTDIFLQFELSYDFEQLYTTPSTFQLVDLGMNTGLKFPTAIGQTNWNLDATISPLTGQDVVNIEHDERIYANGLISGTDLMGELKPADVLKYAMRLTGSYLVETDTTITFIPFADYSKTTAQDFSGKVNFLNPPIVDYRDNELGKDNYLTYKQDDTNTALDPYYLAGNLPTNLGTQIVILYEAPFAQSAFNQTFTGAVSLVRVPYYDAPLAYYYRVWINDSTAYTVGQFVGYLGRLFKVLTNCLGSDGSPIVNTADYEEVDYSVFNEQSPEFRAIEVLTDQVTGVQVYGGTGTLLYTNTITAGLNGIDFAQAITDGYGFIPSTFLDYRQVVAQLNLSDLDIHNLDLSKLVFISELNAYFYINKVEEYTPATNVDTTVTLTMLP